jgi:hypothetical protein
MKIEFLKSYTCDNLERDYYGYTLIIRIFKIQFELIISKRSNK